MQISPPENPINKCHEERIGTWENKKIDTGKSTGERYIRIRKEKLEKAYRGLKMDVSLKIERREVSENVRAGREFRGIIWGLIKAGLQFHRHWQKTC